MPVQVGEACYANAVDAGPAACASFVPVSTLHPDGMGVTTVTCSGANPETGALLLAITSTKTGGATPTVAIIEQLQTFPACTLQDKVDAGIAVFNALLAAFALAIPAYLLYRFLNHNQREQT